MAQNDQIRPMVLVLSRNNTMYFGEYEGRNGDNVCLQNVRCLIRCSEPFYKVASKGTVCMLSNKLDSAEITGVERVVKVGDICANKLSSNPTIHSSNIYDFKKSGNLSLFDMIHIARVDGHDVLNIHGNAVVETHRKGRAGFGYVIDLTLTKHPCYTITFGNTIGIGKTLREAYDNAKMLVLGSNSSNYKVEDYVKYVVTNYPDVDKKVPVLELIELHNIITGSCSKGIRSFLKEHSINLYGTASLRHFLILTKDAYAPEVIHAIAEKYGITI